MAPKRRGKAQSKGLDLGTAAGGPESTNHLNLAAASPATEDIAEDNTPQVAPRPIPKVGLPTGVPEHFQKDIRAGYARLAENVAAVQGAYRAADLARQAVLRLALVGDGTVEAIRAELNTAWDRHLAALRGHRRHVVDCLAFTDSLRAHAKAQIDADEAEVGATRERVDAAYRKVGKGRYHQGAVNEHPDVLAAEARRQRSFDNMQPVLPREPALREELADVAQAISASVYNLLGWQPE